MTGKVLIVGWDGTCWSYTEPLLRRGELSNQSGILVPAEAGVQTGVDLGQVDFVDVVPNVLAAWGLPIPNEVDGTVLEAAFFNAPKQRRANHVPVRTREGPADGSLEVLERLGGLGYLDWRLVAQLSQ